MQAGAMAQVRSVSRLACASDVEPIRGRIGRLLVQGGEGMRGSFLGFW